MKDDQNKTGDEYTVLDGLVWEKKLHTVIQREQYLNGLK